MSTQPTQLARPLLPGGRSGRLLTASNLVFTLGSGMYLTAGVLYFTEAARLPAGQVGFGLAGLVPLVLGIVVGHLASPGRRYHSPSGTPLAGPAPLHASWKL
ncbi:hypothetical protein Dvina_51325 [Dactylosporangium vinaceum]|uniref:MFS transporter n=1 Tax=Dactylosporangium vinaceum TaxID=53362 RepID=A0ABV5M2P1_9ACTN|nr:hypothetical protein [Dactylosporangium vinaceum]UAB96241.1 hypothetical protein Dvina_51325 [Dactylosporangium vinaceum]